MGGRQARASGASRHDAGAAKRVIEEEINLSTKTRHTMSDKALENLKNRQGEV